MQIDENTNIDLNEYETIINELFLLYEDIIKKGIHIEDYIQSIKQHIKLKSKMKMKYLIY